jgi:hypothetical protein
MFNNLKKGFEEIISQHWNEDDLSKETTPRIGDHKVVSGNLIQNTISSAPN